MFRSPPANAGHQARYRGNEMSLKDHHGVAADSNRGRMSQCHKHWDASGSNACRGSDKFRNGLVPIPSRIICDLLALLTFALSFAWSGHFDAQLEPIEAHCVGEESPGTVPPAQRSSSSNGCGCRSGCGRWRKRRKWCLSSSWWPSVRGCVAIRRLWELGRRESFEAKVCFVILH